MYLIEIVDLAGSENTVVFILMEHTRKLKEYRCI